MQTIPDSGADQTARQVRNLLRRQGGGQRGGAVPGVQDDQRPRSDMSRSVMNRRTTAAKSAIACANRKGGWT